MITKFISPDSDCQIEISKADNDVLIRIEHLNPHGSQEFHEVYLDKDDLFHLIGQLLRIQSEIKKEVEDE